MYKFKHRPTPISYDTRLYQYRLSFQDYIDEYKFKYTKILSSYYLLGKYKELYHMYYLSNDSSQNILYNNKLIDVRNVLIDEIAKIFYTFGIVYTKGISYVIIKEQPYLKLLKEYGFRPYYQSNGEIVAEYDM